MNVKQTERVNACLATHSPRPLLRDINDNPRAHVNENAFHHKRINIGGESTRPGHTPVLDPSIGFGMTADQNLEALRRLPELKALGFSVLVGASRKSVLSRFYDPQVPSHDRVFGTLGAHVAAVSRGADIVRVHDVTAHVEACRVADILLRPLP